MIRKSGHRFSEKIMLKQKMERDDDSKKSHPALGSDVQSSRPHLPPSAGQSAFKLRGQL
jgi:hypothetical protein